MIKLDMGFDKDEVRKVLNGDVQRLSCAFSWFYTIQGHKHWWDIHDKRKKLSKRSRQHLNKLLSS